YRQGYGRRAALANTGPLSGSRCQAVRKRERSYQRPWQRTRTRVARARTGLGKVYTGPRTIISARRDGAIGWRTHAGGRHTKNVLSFLPTLRKKIRHISPSRSWRSPPINF